MIYSFFHRLFSLQLDCDDIKMYEKGSIRIFVSSVDCI